MGACATKLQKKQIHIDAKQIFEQQHITDPAKNKFVDELSLIENLLQNRNSSMPKIYDVIIQYIYGLNLFKPMDIQISHPNDKGMHIMAVTNITVYGFYKPSDLAKAAEVSCYKLLSTKLDLNLYLCQQNDIISDGVTLYVSKGIIVKTLSNKIVLCDSLNFMETIETQICYKVRDELDIAVQNQKLIFAGTEVHKNKTLNECNLEGGVTLYLVERLHSG
eukprot:192997_1